MRILVCLLPLLLVGCGNGQDQPPPGASPSMSPERHCEVAREQARQGDCLTAGEHLAFCTGPGSAAARADARAQCGGAQLEPSSAPLTGTEVPPVISGTADPPSEPTVAPSATPSASSTGGTKACNEAISHALARRCSSARSALARCSGPKRATAQANVNANCQKAVAPDRMFR